MIFIIVPILSVLLICNGGQSALTDNKQIFCVFSKNALKRTGEHKFYINNITDQYCTHLIYDFVNIGNDGTVDLLDLPMFDVQENGRKGLIRIFNARKHYNKKMKTIIMFGGWSPSMRGDYYSDILKNEENHNRFVNSSIDFITKYNFDGLSLYWSWPGINGGDLNADKKNMILLLKKLKPELNKRNLLLVIFCHAYAGLLEKSYNIKEITQNVDYIYLLTHNYFGSFSSHIGIASGLYLHPDETDKSLSVDSGVSGWINLGASPEKLLLSVPFFGRTFTLKYENQTNPRSSFISLGTTTKYSTTPGEMTYMELCQRLYDESWTIKWEDTQKNPYAFKGNEWVSYENERSLEEKSKYIIKRNLGGVVVTDVEDDDFKSFCGDSYPLLKVLYKFLRPFDESRVQYIFKVSVFKRLLHDQSTQCIYHDSSVLALE